MIEYLVGFIVWISIVCILMAMVMLIYLAIKWIVEVLKDDSVW